jgi:hypothetical protein
MLAPDIRNDPQTQNQDCQQTHASLHCGMRRFYLQNSSKAHTTNYKINLRLSSSQTLGLVIHKVVS